MQHCLASRNVTRERLGFHELDITPSSRRVSPASRAKRAKRAAARGHSRILGFWASGGDWAGFASGVRHVSSVGCSAGMRFKRRSICSLDMRLREIPG